MATSSKQFKFETPRSGPFWAQGSDTDESSDSDASEEEDYVEELDDSEDDETLRHYQELLTQYDQIPYPEERTYNGRDKDGNRIAWTNVPQPSSRRRVFNTWESRPGGLGLRV
ncbi:unnamed protein product, partial [Allacma fusca]